MNRRRFIKFSALIAALGYSLSTCRQQKRVKANFIGASASVGHLLRDGSFGEPKEITHREIVIVGGGVSGLSAARYIKKKGVTDFCLLELEGEVGGNARSGRNKVSAYPFGAHYIPTPNNNLTEYIDFLHQCGVITEKDPGGLPTYNEFYLCFDPQERLYINGAWQDGLIPHYGVPAAELKQIERFLEQMDHYRYLKGTDGKDAFALPVDDSSGDAAFALLDGMTMKTWMDSQGYTSPYLLWYVNYCTRDDFGTSADKVSAWAGIHYFACRKGRGANAEHSDVLTWPEGNSFLVSHLKKEVQDELLTGSLVTSVTANKEGVLVSYYNPATKELKGIQAKQCILAVPQFIAARLLKDEVRLKKVKEHLQYVPWMVANLTVSSLEERPGAPLSWDNVQYESDSLGYIEATHELLEQRMPKRNLTYYLPLTSGEPASARKVAYQRSEEDWTSMIVADLKRVHPNIETAIEDISIHLWGHAMVQPLPGLLKGGIRQELGASIEDRIHFAHTDLSGISLFEEAFYQGLHAGKKTIG